jgi:hypothetical protein
MAGLRFPESDAEIVLHCDPTLPNPDVSYLVEDVIAFCARYRAAGGKLWSSRLTCAVGSTRLCGTEIRMSLGWLI